MITKLNNLEFKLPGLADPCQTWYKVIGHLSESSVPLIILRGDPEACHEYLLPLADLAVSKPLVFYDQIANGKCGILTAEWTAVPSRSTDLRRLVISNSLASTEVWLVGLTATRKKLDVQEALDSAEKNKDFESPKCEAAVEGFYTKYLSLARPWPAKDPTTYNSIYVRAE
ncbi:hypothetical protein SCAR479_13219 [Seiridium cardinale]|uniref:Uncharacterized protein n=1 Tax=Seiridium cardinale TaxID=138064 RepID=A0ABR2X8K5_9PEZI